MWLYHQQLETVVFDSDDNNAPVASKEMTLKLGAVKKGKKMITLRIQLVNIFVALLIDTLFSCNMATFQNSGFPNLIEIFTWKCGIQEAQNNLEEE